MKETQSCKEVVLKVDTLGRVRTPKGKQEEIVSAYGVSGMTGQQFAAYASQAGFGGEAGTQLI
jgi:hypothetical protein